MSRTAAEYLVQALEKTGVRRIYGVVGDSLNGLTDVLRRRKSIDWVHMRHEEAAAFAERTLSALNVAPADVHRLQTMDYRAIIQAAGTAQANSPQGVRSLSPVVDGRSLPQPPPRARLRAPSR